MNKTYMLDTNVISELYKHDCNPQLMALYLDRAERCAICSTVWQELTFGVKRLPEGKKKKRLSDFLKELHENMDIIPYDKFAAYICSDLLTRAEELGIKRPNNDTQIAATALANGMVLVTHNISDYQPFTDFSLLHVEDWFSA